MDAAWFAVLVLYVVQLLHQRPGTYGLLLAVAALGGIGVGAAGARLTRRLGSWRSLMVACLAMAVTQAVLGLTADVFIAAGMLLVSSAAFALFNMTAVTMRQRVVTAGLHGRDTCADAGRGRSPRRRHGHAGLAGRSVSTPRLRRP